MISGSPWPESHKPNYNVKFRVTYHKRGGLEPMVKTGTVHLQRGVSEKEFRLYLIRKYNEKGYKVTKIVKYEI